MFKKLGAFLLLPLMFIAGLGISFILRIFVFDSMWTALIPLFTAMMLFTVGLFFQGTIFGKTAYGIILIGTGLGFFAAMFPFSHGSFERAQKAWDIKIGQKVEPELNPEVLLELNNYNQDTKNEEAKNKIGQLYWYKEQYQTGGINYDEWKKKEKQIFRELHEVSQNDRQLREILEEGEKPEPTPTPTPNSTPAPVSSKNYDRTRMDEPKQEREQPQNYRPAPIYEPPVQPAQPTVLPSIVLRPEIATWVTMDVEADKTYNFRVTGSMWWSDMEQPVSPRGASWTPRSVFSNARDFGDYPMPDEGYLALVGTFDGETFLVGTHLTRKFDEDGELTLRINAPEIPRELRGQFTVTITIEEL